VFRRVAVAFSVLIGSYVAVSLVIAGVKLAAKGAAPVLFGQSVSSDRSYPDGPVVVAGAFVVSFGLLVGWTVLRAQQGNRSMQILGATCLLLLAAGMVLNATQDADQARCVTDTYLETSRCVSRSWAIARQVLATAFPTALAGLGFLAIRPSSATPQIT
jgi:hypothetical protein